MNEIERERSYPVFLLVSMALHALLFLYAPRLVEGIFPALESGEQGGLTFITLVDVAPPEQVRAAVPEAARRPQSRPTPAPNPEPRPQATQQSVTPAPAPAAQVRPEPADARPQSSAVQVENVPNAQPAPQPERIPAPAAAAEVPRPTPAQQVQPQVQQPVLTSETGTFVADAAPPAAPSETASAPAAASTPVQGEPAAPAVVEEPGALTAPTESGSGAEVDESSSAPNAEIAPEPALPPTGQSMVLSFGGALYPKDAVGLLQRPETVQVAAIVSPDGVVLEGVVIEGSGIPYIDQYAYNIATRAVRYKAYSEVYQISVFVTFNPAQDSLSYRVSDFITVPPRVGSFAEGV